MKNMLTVDRYTICIIHLLSPPCVRMKLFSAQGVPYRRIGEGITTTPFCFYKLNIRSCFLHLLSQITNIYHYKMIVAHAVISPNKRINSCERNNYIGSLCQKTQNIKLTVGQMNNAAIEYYFA